MIVAVMSPYTRGNGNTVTSILLAMGLASMNKKVLLTHTNPTSLAFFKYFGLPQTEDKTTTPTQLVKLLRQEAIKPEEITDYCKHLEHLDNVDIFTTLQESFEESDMLAFSDFMLQLSTYDFIVYDVNSVDTPTAQLVLKKADMVIYNFTQSTIELTEFKENEQKYLKLANGKKTLVVCNKFDKIAGNEKDMSKYLKLGTRFNVINYNPWVINATNNGKMVLLYNTIKNKASTVIELNSDMTRLATMVSKAKIKVTRERNQEKIKQRGGGVDVK